MCIPCSVGLYALSKRQASDFELPYKQHDTYVGLGHASRKPSVGNPSLAAEAYVGSSRRE